MIFFDFSKRVIPKSENPYFQRVISFVENWEAGIKMIQIRTSGSTGIPKLIDVKRSQMVASARLTGDFFGLIAGNHIFCCLNIDFIAGMMMMVRGMELRLQVTVIEPVNNPFLNVHSGRKIDFAAFVPMQLQAILENNTTLKYLKEEAGLKNVIVGGAVINDRVLEQIEQIDIPFFATYGMTETVSHIAIKPLNGLNKSNYFKVLNGINIEIDDRNCLKIKGDCTDNQWIQTHDLVELKDAHSFILLGRANRVVNSGGVKIYLDLVEKELAVDLENYFQKSLKYFLFGIPDEKLGEKLAIIIEAENSKFATNPKEIFKKSILDKYKIPKVVYYLPKFIETESGKTDFQNTVNIIFTHN